MLQLSALAVPSSLPDTLVACITNGLFLPRKFVSRTNRQTGLEVPTKTIPLLKESGIYIRALELSCKILIMHLICLDRIYISVI